MQSRQSDTIAAADRSTICEQECQRGEQCGDHLFAGIFEDEHAPMYWITTCACDEQLAGFCLEFR